MKKKLILKKVTLVELDDAKLKQVKGGYEEGKDFLSIGHECSSWNSCKRVSNREFCYCETYSQVKHPACSDKNFDLP